MHLVLGATGGFGSAMVRALTARGLPVRVLVRDPTRAPAGVEVISGDATRSSDVVAAAAGCVSITHGLNLPWSEWQPGLLAFTDNVVEASGASGATIVFPGTVLGLKPIYGVPLSPVSAQIDVNDRPSIKGRVRNMIEDQLAQHAELANIRTLVVRAGDWYGPGVRDPVVAPMFRAALAGEPISWFGTATTGHAFTFVDDVAAAAVGLLLQPGRPTHDVVAVAGEVYPDAAAWAAELGKAVGRTVSVRTVSPWQLQLRGLLNRDAREMAELLYQWEGPILLDDARVRRALPEWAPTPVAEAVRMTVDWHRANGAR